MDSSRTQKVRKINDRTMIVAVDIGKGFHVGYFRGPNGEERKPFPFYNSAKSFNEFWGSVCEFFRKHDLKEVVVGFESSGPYAEPFFHYLRKKPVTLVQVNPMHTKRVKELTGNSPNKTDRKDPRVIADVISLGHALTLVVPKGPAAHLRRLTQARERALKRRTAAVNQLQDLIFVIFPEFLKIMKGISTKTAFYLIKKDPTAEGIVALGLEPLTTLIKTTSRGKLGRQRAEELFDAAQSCVGVQEGKRSIVLEIEYLVSQIGADSRFIVGLEKQMGEYLQEIPYSQSVLSIKGIGRVTAAGLIGEVGDFRKFRTISEITKLAGLDLFEISSGKHRGRRRISKRGRAVLRKLLFFAAINVVKTNGILHEPYQQMLCRGMPKVKALIAIARKLLRIVFALARDNTVYVENYVHNQHLKLAA
ncbi:MAG: IS110 family transposase [Desulfobacteraceae bacterium]|nr:IS110 family transposase [Desulfobacteraceae bacterium]